MCEKAMPVVELQRHMRSEHDVDKTISLKCDWCGKLVSSTGRQLN